MKAICLGWEKQDLDQISRIRQGMIANGIELVSDGPCDFIYCHDSTVFDLGIEFKNKYPQSKLLLKVLDLNNFTEERKKELLSKLEKADLILANSKYVQKDIKEKLGLESVVVYDCIKDLEILPDTKKEIDFLAVGRLQSPEKRAWLIKEFMFYKDNRNKILAMCGPENPGFGCFLGVVTDKILQDLYNSAKFTLCLSKDEGLLLPAIEAMACGNSIPIVCSDLTTKDEVCPPEFVCDPNKESIHAKIEEIEKNYSKYQSIATETGKEFKKKFCKEQIARNIINAYESLCGNNKNI